MHHLGRYLSFFWLAVGLLGLGQDYLFAVLKDAPFYWDEALLFKLYWLLLIPITLIVFRLGDWFPLQHPVQFRNGAIHLSASLLVGLLHLTAFAALMTAGSRWLAMEQPFRFEGIFRKMLATNLLYSVLMYWLMLGTHKALSFYRQWQQSRLRTAEMERQLSESRLSFLKSQLQPHFLFNALHAVVTLVQLHDNDRAAAMLTKLSELLRHALKDNQVHQIPLHREIELLELYLSVQRVRFEDKLLVNLRVPPGMEQALVPYMILQPLVENAIKYAVETANGPCRITVEARQQHGQLRLEVRDEGRSGRIPVRRGNGLRLTASRLESLYGGHFSLDVTPNQPAGTIVALTFPLQYDVQSAHC